MLPTQTDNVTPAQLAGKKILFATFPADGHFNPLTGLAVHLQSLGCDVRWYTSAIYAPKLRRLGIPHLPFIKAKDINSENIERLLPERKQIHGQVKKLNFDMLNVFILRSCEYYEDIKEIRESFSFDMVVADCLFTGIPFITDLLKVPVISIGVLPLTATSKDLAPPGLGMMPSYTMAGKIKQWVLRGVAGKILFAKTNKAMRAMLDRYNIDHHNLPMFDVMPAKASLLLQSGTPGFEYFRSDLAQNVRFVGALLPYQRPGNTQPWFDQRLNSFRKVVIVTQGTVEKDIEKLLVPTLEALKDSDILVVATTGGNGTDELRARFRHRNIIIEDFIPFADVMPYADAYITNGGYGGVMLGIENKLPLVVGGIHEGKNEINARIGYFKLGINLGTEKPRPQQMEAAVTEVLSNPVYKQQVEKLSVEFKDYEPLALCTGYIASVLATTGVASNTTVEEIY